MLKIFIGMARQRAGDVGAQLGQAHAAVLEKIVVLHLRVIEREYRLQVAVLPGHVIAQHHLKGEFCLFGGI